MHDRFSNNNSWSSAISKALVTTCFVLVFAVSARATDLHVPSASYPTIGDAVAAASAGDRILVAHGVYQENVVSTVANLQFIGRGAIWDGTLTNGTAGVCLTASGGGTLVQGFAFRAGQGGTAQVQLTGDDCRVIKCSSRGPSARFLLINGNSAVVDSCSLFAVNSTAIQITGDRALVQKIKARQCDDNVVQVNGNFASVMRCSMILNEDSYSISITGSNAVVALNKFVDCDEIIRIVGDNAVVENNKALHTSDIEVQGDNLTIRKNSMTSAPDDNTGIFARSRTGAGGGVIEDNKIKDVTQAGLDIGCHNVAVRRNAVTGAGTESNESGCRVSGNFNTLSDNKIVGGGTHGFDVSGATNTLARCTAVDAAADGFHVSGNGNTLMDCSATLCTGEGLDNGGTGTTVLGCKFMRNRIDVANDGTFVNDATFAADNVFSTGGTTQPPQVD